MPYADNQTGISMSPEMSEAVRQAINRVPVDRRKALFGAQMAKRRFFILGAKILIRLLESKHRFLGEILIEDFGVDKKRVERALQQQDREIYKALGVQLQSGELSKDLTG